MANVFVFGSNTEGRHGKGTARIARKNYGALNGQAWGRHGDSYAIVTKELRQDYPQITIRNIQVQVIAFLKYAKEHPKDIFYVTPIGCGLARFKPEQIGPMFKGAPGNVKLPSEFKVYDD